MDHITLPSMWPVGQCERSGAVVEIPDLECFLTLYLLIKLLILILHSYKVTTLEYVGKLLQLLHKFLKHLKYKSALL